MNRNRGQIWVPDGSRIIFDDRWVDGPMVYGRFHHNVLLSV